jgi:hypothetical protein
MRIEKRKHYIAMRDEHGKAEVYVACSPIGVHAHVEGPSVYMPTDEALHYYKAVVEMIEGRLEKEKKR